MTQLIKTPAEKEQEARVANMKLAKQQEESFKDFRKNRKLETELMQEELDWYSVLLELKEAKNEYHTEEVQAQKMIKTVVDNLIGNFKLDQDAVYKHVGFPVIEKEVKQETKTE